MKQHRKLFELIPKCEAERRLRANDRDYNSQFQYTGNHIQTYRYNLLTFIPLNLFEQFQRVANIYFLIQIIIMSIPQITALNPLATAIPLLFVLTASAVKDLYDDVGRHKSDNRVNNRKAHLLRDGIIVNEAWQNVQVGDIIKLESNHHVTADLLLLSTSEPSGLCYIETAELDGETNLKVRQPLIETAALGDDLIALSNFRGEVTCEPPNNRLDKFQGKLEIGDEKCSLDNSNIVLRGCVLRNTEWVFGLVIFAGHDTKLMMNSGKAAFKRTKLDKLANDLVLNIALALIIICTFLSFMSYFWEKGTGKGFTVYLPWDSYYKENPALIGVFHWPAFIMVLNTLIPISLYISVEIIRFGQSLLINWDLKMYHAPSDTPARARNTTLNEELGQIQYIFSDKTGTLTQNVMTFKECSINGKLYGHEEEDPEPEVDNLKIESVSSENMFSNTKRPIDLSSNPYADPVFKFYDQTLIPDLENDQNVIEFFRLLALCHTVMVEERDEVDYMPGAETQDTPLLEYQAQSPDEGALVSAARNFGFVFLRRTPNTITIKVNGNEEKYDLLCILDFDNVRKRMSVIVQDKDGKIKLYCKGADTVIYERLSNDNASFKETTQIHLDLFACNGLRTLCLAYKEIPEHVFDKWAISYKDASCALENRDEMIAKLYEEIEQDMTLIGATAIEDKLQDGVPETIANLAEANINLWVLTGDKQETAINIGYSCMLLTENMHDVFIINGKDKQTVVSQMESCKSKIDSSTPSIPHKQNDVELKGITGRRGSHVMFSDNQIDEVSELEPKSGFGLVINGNSLVFALDKSLEMQFLELAKCCKAVICCRVTPLQKAMVVDLVKRHVKATTLAIGDGANDVSMIQAAHIGVGISGQEGMQAVLASDFSIAQFRFLEKLLLVHGRWSYLRMSKFLNYFFYKNFAFTLCQFWFNLFVGFSAQTLYDAWFISFYNVCFTSCPVLALGLFDKDVDEKLCLDNPKLYVPGQENILFNKKSFTLKLLHGIVTSALLYFIPYGVFHRATAPDGIDLGDTEFFSTTVACCLVVIVNLQISLDTQYWTWMNHFVIWGSIIFYFMFSFTLYSPEFYSLAIGGVGYVGMAVNVFGSGIFWLTLILTAVVCILPVVGYRWLRMKIRPTLAERIRKGEWKQRRTPAESLVSLRRSRASLRSRRSSKRSGYAFSHQSGFGDLIMSGKWLPSFKFRHSKSYDAASAATRTSVA
ncbi:phospholipid-transporting ATPase ID-like isoform X2 [Rhopilema esculentum]|uniref:phospholipid-transporting ATPase ID-like isoform X2 n=1 Tax=Rhopilema esculentum TaxID=499914 RepID=UPI0031D0D41A